MRKYRKMRSMLQVPEAINQTQLRNCRPKRLCPTTAALKSAVAEIYPMHGKVAVAVCVRHQ